MRATAILSRPATVMLIIAAVACGGSPTAPGQPGSKQPPAGQTTFTIVDGWSRQPVAGASVTANGTQALTDAAGQVRFPTPQSSCVTIDVKAAGFLDRRTCGSSSAVQITLWPIANADEGDVTHKWIFYNDRIESGFWSVPIRIALGPELAARADVVNAWSAAADTISQVSQGRIRFQWVTSAPDEGLIVEAATLPLSCSVTLPWPYEIAGFCVTYDPVVYYLDRLRVAPQRLADPPTVLRALLSDVGIRAHTLPGLLNQTRPDAEFSEYERKTLGMLGLRPRTVIWPDYDQIQ